MPVNGKAAVAVGVGSILMYSGIKGYSLLRAFQNIVKGQAASTGQTTSLISSGSPSPSGGGIESSEPLVAESQKYIGHDYAYGGAPGPNGTDPWDCSSAVNWCATQVGLPIPGDSPWNPSTHGPATGAWMVSSLLTTVSAANAQPGCIVVGPTHMGIYLGNGQYWSAHDPAEGTTNSPVSEFPDVVMLYRAYK
jgi:peptidoglycan DL-endopeptidase CwlO